MKTFTAIILNIVYPGAGYLYLRDPIRRPAALFMVTIWTLFVGGLTYVLIRSVVTSDFSAFAGATWLPSLLVVALWVWMCVDTYFLARKLGRASRS